MTPHIPRWSPIEVTGRHSRIDRAPTSCTGDQEFSLQSSPTNDVQIYTCHFLARHSALLGKGKDWLAQRQDNVTVQDIRVMVSAAWLHCVTSGHGAGGLVS